MGQGKWTEVAGQFFYSIPHRPGCYVYILDNRYAYIGSSQDMAARFFQHGIKPSWGCGFMTPWGTCRTLRIKYKITGYYRQLEERLIKRIQPSLNCHHSTRRSHGVTRVGGFPVLAVVTKDGTREGFARVEEFVRGEIFREVA